MSTGRQDGNPDMEVDVARSLGQQRENSSWSSETGPVQPGCSASHKRIFILCYPSSVALEAKRFSFPLPLVSAHLSCIIGGRRSSTYCDPSPFASVGRQHRWNPLLTTATAATTSQLRAKVSVEFVLPGHVIAARGADNPTGLNLSTCRNQIVGETADLGLGAL